MGSIECKFRRSNAYHEAGHAVALYKGKHSALTRGLSIVPSSNSAGRTEVGFEYIPDWNISRESSEYRTIVLLAGRAAERRLYDVNSGFDASSRRDLKMAKEYVAEIVTEKQERRAVMRSLVLQTNQLMETHWPIIEAVAETLLLEENMDGERFMEIVDAAEAGESSAISQSG